MNVVACLLTHIEMRGEASHKVHTEKLHCPERELRIFSQILKSSDCVRKQARSILLVEVPVQVTEALRNAKELSLSFVNGPLRSGFGNRYRYR